MLWLTQLGDIVINENTAESKTSVSPVPISVQEAQYSPLTGYLIVLGDNVS